MGTQINFSAMRTIVKRVLPNRIIRAVRWTRRYFRDRHNKHRNPGDIFSEVYARGHWGGAHGEFCSGSGSVSQNVVDAYVSAVVGNLRSLNQLNSTFVDLGCGDLRVGRHLMPHCSQYVGVDVVPKLIDWHNRAAYPGHVRFECLDIVRDNLPRGNVCFLRQVLQHLSNEQIGTILRKLKSYDVVYITEHYPDDGPHVLRNAEKVCGASIRAEVNSGVYLDSEPFNLPRESLSLILDVPAPRISVEVGGRLRTYRYQPRLRDS